MHGKTSRLKIAPTIDYPDRLLGLAMRDTTLVVDSPPPWRYDRANSSTESKEAQMTTFDLAFAYEALARACFESELATVSECAESCTL
jgi:hypothetical protein